MKLAFLISAYTDPHHLRRLISALPAGSEFYIHIDSKSDIRMFRELLSRSDVFFIGKRMNVVWGGFTQVQYQMELIRAALGRGNADYLISLSGMEYPLWSNDKIMAFFANARGKNFLQGISMLHQGEASRQYREYRFWMDKPWNEGSIRSKMRVALRKIIAASGFRKPLIIRCPGKNYTLYKGSDWWGITSQLAAYVLHEWDGNKTLTNYFKTSFCPSETFIHTVAFNSAYASRCMLAEGPYQSLAALTPLCYIDYNPVIKILTENDYNILRTSGKMLCRKVISGDSDTLVRMIDRDRNLSGGASPAPGNRPAATRLQ